MGNSSDKQKEKLDVPDEMVLTETDIKSRVYSDIFADNEMRLMQEWQQSIAPKADKICTTDGLGETSSPENISNNIEEPGTTAPHQEYQAFVNGRNVKCASMEQKTRLEGCCLKLNTAVKYSPNLEDLRVPPGVKILPYLNLEEFRICRLVCRNWDQAVISSTDYLSTTAFIANSKPSWTTVKVNGYVKKYIKSLEEEWIVRRHLWLEKNKHNPSSIRKKSSLYTYATFKEYVADPINRAYISQVPFQLPEVGETEKNPILQDRDLSTGENSSEQPPVNQECSEKLSVNTNRSENLPAYTNRSGTSTVIPTEQVGTQITSSGGESDLPHIQCVRTVRISFEETDTDYTPAPSSLSSRKLLRARKKLKPVLSRIPVPLASSRSLGGNTK